MDKGKREKVEVDNVTKDTEHSSWVECIAERLETSVQRASYGAPCTIFHVPQLIRQSDDEAYEPKIISIGPYHRGKKRLQAMDEQKWHYLYSILSRDQGKSLGDYLNAIEPLEEKARSCYAERTDLDRNEFVEMMLIDGCFIVELFLNQNRKETIEADPVYSTNWMLPLIAQDLLLLENQLPFFILECLFSLVYQSNPCLVIDLALSFFDHLLPMNAKTASAEPVHHLLHLFHTHLLPAPLPERLLSHGHIDMQQAFSSPALETFEHKLPLHPKSIPSAQEIQRAGIKFKNKISSSLLDINFSKNVIEIPGLSIYESTNLLFRNLIAFEQCYAKAGTHFTNYALFMYYLLEATKDVAILKQNKIIEHWLGSDEEVILVFRRMCKGITINFHTSYFSRVLKEVGRVCESHWNTWRATLMRDYFNNPWSILQFEAAVLALVFTLVQTFLAVLAYYRPRG